MAMLNNQRVYIYNYFEFLGVHLDFLAIRQVCNHDFAWFFEDGSRNKSLAGHMELELEEIIQTSDI